MAKHNFRVGDEFEGSPIQLNHWVTPVWAAGGRVEFDGETATIVYLPEEEEDEVVEEVKVEAPAPVEEEIIPAPLPIEELEPVAVEPEVVAEVDPEVAIAPSPVAEEPALVEEVKPVKTYTRSPGRPKKSSEPVEEVN